jgi:hypothetical protein
MNPREGNRSTRSRIGRGSSRISSLVARKLAAALALSAVLAGASSPADAQVRVEGSIAALRIEATRVPLADVLAALGPALNVQYRTAIALQTEISGSYAGPFGQVIARLLDGYNYVLRNDNGSIEVLVVGRRGERAVVTATPPAPLTAPAQSPAAQWRATPKSPTPGR